MRLLDLASEVGEALENYNFIPNLIDDTELMLYFILMAKNRYGCSEKENLIYALRTINSLIHVSEIPSEKLSMWNQWTNQD